MQETRIFSPQFLNRREASVYLAISQRKLDQLTASGELKRFKIDACIRFDVDDLRAFADARKEGGEAR
jgi:hypothetical protein